MFAARRDQILHRAKGTDPRSQMTAYEELMSAFQPIPPRNATEIFAAAGIHEGMAVIAALAEAGLVKAYARMMERVQPSGVRETVRDKRIPPELWRRIIAEGKVDDVVSGTVRLDGSPEFGGGPKITLIGIRFDPDTLARAATDHGPDVPKPWPNGSCIDSVKTTVIEPPAAEAAVSTTPARPGKPISENAELLSVEEAMEVLKVGRTKLYEMINAGTLDARKNGRSTRITRESIDRFLGKSR